MWPAEGEGESTGPQKPEKGSWEEGKRPRVIHLQPKDWNKCLRPVPYILFRIQGRGAPVDLFRFLLLALSSLMYLFTHFFHSSKMKQSNSGCANPFQGYQILPPQVTNWPGDLRKVSQLDKSVSSVLRKGYCEH